MNWNWILFPLVGGLIGWVTNRLAIKMLFRPRKPVKIPVLGWEIQGLLPKRHTQLAKVISQTVEKDLMTTDALVDKLKQSGYREQALKLVNDYVVERLEQALPRFIPQALVNAFKGYIIETVEQETAGLVDKVEDTILANVQNNLSISSIVEEKVLAFDLDEFERIVLQVASTELGYIEILGGVLGVLIGLIQTVIITYIL
jgi:uncharacterized membrane protein YheB (UPF0754 family)